MPFTKILYLNSYYQDRKIDEYINLINKCKIYDIELEIFNLSVFDSEDPQSTSIMNADNKEIETKLIPTIEKFQPNLIAIHSGLTLFHSTIQVLQVLFKCKELYPELSFLIEEKKWIISNSPEKLSSREYLEKAKNDLFSKNLLIHKILWDND